MEESAVDIKFPIDFDRFTRTLLNYKEITCEILKDYSKGDLELFEKLISNESVTDCVLKSYYKCFYTCPEIRKKYRFQICPMPAVMKELFLKTASVSVRSIPNPENNEDESKKKNASLKKRYPVSLETFRTYINENDILDVIFKLKSKGNAQKFETLRNNTRQRHFYMLNFYKSFYKNRELCYKFKYNFNAAPAHIKELILQPVKYETTQLENAQCSSSRENFIDFIPYDVSECISQRLTNTGNKNAVNEQFMNIQADNVVISANEIANAAAHESQYDYLGPHSLNNSTTTVHTADIETVTCDDFNENLRKTPNNRLDSSQDDNTCTTAETVIEVKSSPNLNHSVSNLNRAFIKDHQDKNLFRGGETNTNENRKKKYPVDLHTFRKYINEKELLNQIFRAMSKGDTAMFESLMNNKEENDRLMKLFYKKFYKKRDVVKNFNYNFNAAPDKIRELIYQLPSQEQANKKSSTTQVFSCTNSPSAMIEEITPKGSICAEIPSLAQCVTNDVNAAVINAADDNNNRPVSTEQLSKGNQEYSPIITTASILPKNAESAYKDNANTRTGFDNCAYVFKNFNRNELDQIVHVLNKIRNERTKNAASHADRSGSSLRLSTSINSGHEKEINLQQEEQENNSNGANKGNSQEQTETQTQQKIVVSRKEYKSIEAYFTPSRNCHNLNYISRISSGMSQMICRAILQMTFEEFQAYTRIYNANIVYIIFDDKKLYTLYEHVIKNCQFPINLHIEVRKLPEYLHTKDIQFELDDLAEVTPKLFHWSDLIQCTNFQTIVELDYWKRNAVKLKGRQNWRREISNFYERCWETNSWIWQAPKLIKTENSLSDISECIGNISNQNINTTKDCDDENDLFNMIEEYIEGNVDTNAETANSVDPQHITDNENNDVVSSEVTQSGSIGNVVLNIETQEATFLSCSQEAELISDNTPSDIIVSLPICDSEENTNECREHQPSANEVIHLSEDSLISILDKEDSDISIPDSEDDFIHNANVKYLNNLAFNIDDEGSEYQCWYQAPKVIELLDDTQPVALNLDQDNTPHLMSQTNSELTTERSRIVVPTACELENSQWQTKNADSASNFQNLPNQLTESESPRKEEVINNVCAEDCTSQSPCVIELYDTEPLVDANEPEPAPALPSSSTATNAKLQKRRATHLQSTTTNIPTKRKKNSEFVPQIRHNFRALPLQTNACTKITISQAMTVDETLFNSTQLGTATAIDHCPTKEN